MHRGTHDRGYLPHRDYRDAIQGLTFRLADSVPTRVIQRWNDELDRSAALRHQTEEMLRQRIAAYEDAGHRACELRHPEAAATIENLLIQNHRVTYQLYEWCVMPNHVHVLIKLSSEEPLAKIVKDWKGPSAVAINRLLGRRGRLWMREYFDRAIRDQDHFDKAAAYIRRNPVKAGLCATPEDWPFSSAGHHWTP